MSEASRFSNEFDSTDAKRGGAFHGNDPSAWSIRSAEDINPPEDSWEAIPFPKSISLEDLPTADAEPVSNGQPDAELLTLIRDLNACNDALLARVKYLEESLENSQLALQAEVERSHTEIAGMGQAVQASAMTQQQLAQLLTELDFANDALKREHVRNESLQTQLDVSQQRMAQLERECALLQQRYGEKSQALQNADMACRDLRARLQRQQRYTLQFKAALEKCLDMSNTHTQSPTFSVDGQPDLSAMPMMGTAPTMPRAQRIQPWSLEDEGTSGDPSLDALIRRFHPTPEPAPEAPPTSAAPLPVTAPSTTPVAYSASFPPAPVEAQQSTTDAEDTLWKDVERVIQQSASTANSATPNPSDVDWSDANPGKPPSPLPITHSQPDTRVAARVPAPLTHFTEPSPWGAPLNSPSPTSEEITDTPASVEPLVAAAFTDFPADTANPTEPVAVPSAQAKTGLPVFTAQMAPNAPAPIVHPLRPTKKIKSLAAVDLPSFPRLPRPS